MMHKAWCNMDGVPGLRNNDFNLVGVRLLGWSQLSNPADLPCFVILRYNSHFSTRGEPLYYVLWTLPDIFNSIIWGLFFSCRYNITTKTYISTVLLYIALKRYKHMHSYFMILQRYSIYKIPPPVPHPPPPHPTPHPPPPSPRLIYNFE